MISMGWMEKAPAQMPPMDSLYAYSLTHTLPTKSLLGEWQSADSLSRRYTFTCNPNGWECQFMGYFFTQSSTGQIKPQGYIPNWPPFYCWISLINEKTITLYFYSTGLPTSTLTLIRPDSAPKSDH